MPVYALFSNEPRRVLVERFLPGDKRLEFLPLNLEDKGLINSAETGFYATYHILESIENLCISYEIEGGAEKITGSSAGLAFALALYETLSQKQSYLAATGNISDGTRNARVLPVEMIPEKLTSGITALSAGEQGTIFYPSGNDMDISEEIRRTAHEKGIALKPVKTLAEAVEALQTTEEREESSPNYKGNEGDMVRRVNPFIFIFLLMIFIYLGGGLILQFMGPCSLPKEIRAIAPFMYPWSEKCPLELKVISSPYENEILPLLKQGLLPAFKAENWHLRASFSCGSRLINQRYTYWMIFKEAALDIGNGQKKRLSLGTCEGSGFNLESAKGQAIDNMLIKLLDLGQKLHEKQYDH